ncbi:MAG: hypothetical protein BWZ09_02436 [Alphaproteobacteria bacterium ADurb.BinA305]|nr:MAG: hypothetical protein BWZ09_02436 [Alphaproteobacteria bacterium ADurb.BinA305]
MTTPPKAPPVNPLRQAGSGLNMNRMCDFHGRSAPVLGGRIQRRTGLWKCAACIANDNSAKEKA